MAKATSKKEVVQTAEPAVAVEHIPLIALHHSPTNPRKTYPERELAELAESIRAQGIINPITVRPFYEENKIVAYEVVAGRYNSKFDNSFDAAEEEFIFDQFRHLIRANDVLDIGCGTGLVKRLADRDLFKMRSYTGVDYSEGMIKVAKAKYLGTVFIQDDMVEFMNRVCEPGSFDTVVAMYCPLNYCEQHQTKVYAAVRRVLKHGGHFINVAASSRYAARESHVISASNMRRYFDDSPYHIDMMEDQFSVVSIHGANYAIEKYRRWLELCPKIVNKRLFKFDSEQFKQSSRKPLLYTFILQKL